MRLLKGNPSFTRALLATHQRLKSLDGTRIIDSMQIIQLTEKPNLKKSSDDDGLVLKRCISVKVICRMVFLWI